MNGQELLSAVGWKSIPVMTPASCRGKSWTVFPICRHEKIYKGCVGKKVLTFDAVSNSPYVSQEELADYW